MLSRTTEKAKLPVLFALLLDKTIISNYKFVSTVSKDTGSKLPLQLRRAGLCVQRFSSLLYQCFRKKECSWEKKETNNCVLLPRYCHWSRLRMVHHTSCLNTQEKRSNKCCLLLFGSNLLPLQAACFVSAHRVQALHGILLFQHLDWPCLGVSVHTISTPENDLFKSGSEFS